MAKKIAINKLTNANLYIDGQSYLGRAEEVTLPEIKETMTEHKGLGMHGKTELPGGLEKMEAKIKFNSFYPEAFAALGDPRRALLIQARGNLETHSGLGLENEVAVVVELGGRVSVTSPGAFKQNDATMPEVTMSVTFYKLVIDGQVIIEIDILENVRKVNGVDILANMRRNIGA